MGVSAYTALAALRSAGRAMCLMSAYVAPLLVSSGLLRKRNQTKSNEKKRKEPPYGWKKNSPGLQKDHCRAAPYDRYRIPSSGGDATGITRSKQRPEERMNTKKRK